MAAIIMVTANELTIGRAAFVPSVLLVGCGRVVEEGHIAAYQSSRERMTASVLVDTSAQRRDAIGTVLGIPTDLRFDDISSAMRMCSPSVAVVAVPTGQHRDIVAELLRASCPVLCEKPLAPQLDEALALAALATDRKVALNVMHNYRFAPRFVELAGVAGIEVGRILEVEISVSESCPLRGYDVRLPEWRRDFATHGTCMHDQGYHYIDWIEQLLGGSITEVRPHSIIPIGSAAAMSVRLSLDNGAVATLTLDWACDQHHSTTIRLTGDSATINFLDDSGELTVSRATQAGCERQKLAADLSDDGFRVCLPDYITALATSRPAPTSLLDAIHVLNVVDCCMSACADRRPTVVPSLTL